MSNVKPAGSEPFSRANTVHPQGAVVAAAVPKEQGLLDTYRAMPTAHRVAVQSWALTFVVGASSAPGEACLVALAASLLATGVAMFKGPRS